MMKKLFLLWFAVLAASAVAAQPFWEKKAYTEWSKGDCRKMLEDSPWARKEVVFSKVEGDRFGQPTRGESRQTEQHIWYTAQFRSAQPVRQAVVRQAAIENKYDQMSAEQKKDFDDSAAGFVDQTYPGAIVLYVEYGSNVQFYERELMRFWHDFTLTKFHDHVYLSTSSGQRVAPTEWKPAPGSALGFQLVFPRLVNNEPWVLESDKWLKLEFPNPKFEELRQDVGAAPNPSFPTQIATIEFKIEKMKLKEALVY